MTWLARAATLAMCLLATCRLEGDTMGTQYNGVASNITIQGSLNVASMSGSGTNPTLVTTTAPHGLTSGDTVDINNADGNTATNGQWPVTVTSATQVSIPVTGNGTYTGVPGATMTPITFGSTFQIPSDGDLLSASNNNIAPEALADRTAYMLTLIGDYKMIQQGQDFQNDPTLAVGWSTINSSVTAWTAAASGTHIPLVTIGSLHQLDWVEFDLGCYIVNSSSSGQSVVSFGYSEVTPGVAAPAYQKVQGSGTAICSGSLGAEHSLIGRHQMGVNGSLKITIGQTISAAVNHVNVGQGDFFFRWRVWRPVNVNQ